MREKTTTIYDIAKEAGVSSATVSRVLTNSANVSRDKREAVERLIEKYQFRPNTLARGLSNTRTMTLGLIVADIRNPYYSALAVECEKAASRLGYTVLLCNALSDRDLEDQNLEKLYDQRADAIIQIGCRADDLISDPDYVAHVNRVGRTIPFVTTGKLDGVQHGRVSIDFAAAMGQVFDYLVSLGHTAIALIGGRKQVRSTYDMWQHYIYLLGRHGLTLREEYVLDGDYSDEGGYRCMNELLGLEAPPTAVIAINDYAAVGALKAASERGYKVPGDISLVGFDNTFLSEIVTPRLTTVDYQYPDFGRKLVNAAVYAIEHGRSAEECLIHPRLIVRDSCARPKPKN